MARTMPLPVSSVDRSLVRGGPIELRSLDSVHDRRARSHADEERLSGTIPHSKRPPITVTIASACFIATPTVSPKNTTKSSML